MAPGKDRTLPLEKVFDGARELIALLGARLGEQETLQRSLRILCDLVGARYGAIGLLNEGGGLAQFIYHGLTEAQAAAIGSPPSGIGLLGALIRAGEIIVLEDLTTDPRHSGFPPHHPPMKTFLGVPIQGHERTYGRLYLTEKAGGVFTKEDAALVQGFARSLGTVLDNLRLARAQADFLAMLTHDIRSPLNVVLGYTQMLREDAASRLRAEQMEMLHHIEEGAARILHLVENFLLASRLDAGRFQLQLGECDLATILERLAARHRRIAQARSICIELKVRERPCPVRGDREALDRVFSNLLTNALKHSPERSAIEISACSDGVFVTAAVRDHGPGIRPEDRPILFQRYGRIPGSSSLGGTGLGLHIVKMITEAHGGQVEVESVPGEGACFIVRLPASR